jgi:hypothetical protein
VTAGGCEGSWSRLDPDLPFTAKAAPKKAECWSCLRTVDVEWVGEPGEYRLVMHPQEDRSSWVPPLEDRGSRVPPRGDPEKLARLAESVKLLTDWARGEPGSYSQHRIARDLADAALDLAGCVQEEEALRDPRDIRGVIDAAEIVQQEYRNGELNHLGIATAAGHERYAAGVAEALHWVLGEPPWADLERLLDED